MKLADLTQDWSANRGYPKSQVVLVLFRAAQQLRRTDASWARPAYLLVGTGYKLISEWLLGVELPVRTEVGPGLRLRHGVGLVVNPHARIGAGVMLRHGVTIGNRRAETDCPVIEDGVELGANVVIIGSVRIGADARIGAGSVVVHDVPARATVHPGPVVVRPAAEDRSP
ncbi:serine acetyltransferase [Kineosporia babensis]|uniref:serine acetyltransferase n=1 Tax=Kineosporia babensis TaxID=499548 RepID=UPI0022AEC302|nr:serine acetyltransferase [Kineosporia babensis]